MLWEKKPVSEIVCCKCDKEGHFPRSCTAKTLHVQKRTEKTSIWCMLGEREVNGQPVRRIQINSGASRTVVYRSLISPADNVTFGNGTFGEYLRKEWSHLPIS